MTRTRLIPDWLREPPPRPTDVGMTLAKGLLVRSLRQGGLHHVLRGQPCIVAFVVADEDLRRVFMGAAKALLRELLRDYLGMLDTDNEVVMFDGGKFKRTSDSGFLRDALASHLRYIAFAPCVDDLPALVRVAADAILTPAVADRRALAGPSGRFSDVPRPRHCSTRARACRCPCSASSSGRSGACGR